MQAIRPDARPLGVVYTPPEVTGPMVARALAPLLADRTAEQLAALRICDPALGEGAFLLEIVRVVEAALRAAGADDARALAARCIYGVDVDERAVAAAQAALGLDDSQLRVADALALDWPDAFPEIFAAGGFDAVIGNPPYVRQEHLSDHKPRLRSFSAYDGSADLYVYFVELAHRLARPHGRFCLITPNKWLTASYGRALRTFLAAQSTVEGIVDLGRSELFAGADAFPCILWGTITPTTTPIQAARLPAHASLTLDTGAPHLRTRWHADPWHIDAPSESALIDRLEARWPSLGDLLPGPPARGLVTGCNRAFVLDRPTRDRLLTDEPAAASVIRPFIKGRDLRRWLPSHPERWVLLIDRSTSLDELPATLAHLTQFRTALEPRPSDHPAATWPGRKPGTYRWYELQDPVGAQIRARTPRLLYQDIQSAPLCAIDLHGEAVPDTTVWMLPTADLYLLAILCSPLYYWYARRRFPPALNGSVRPKLEYMRRLPIASPSPDLRAHITSLVEQRLAGSPDLDAAIDHAIHDAYQLSAADIALLTT